jgi:hypothetical protein
LNHVTLSSDIQRDPVAAYAVARAPASRLFFFIALFFIAELLLALSTHGSRALQWSALLLLCVVGMACTVIIVGRRDTIGITANAALWLAVATRLPSLFAAPLFDDDYFRFLWDGYQLISGVSPYAASPAAHFSNALNDPAWEAVLTEINHPDVPTIYGPSLQALFGLAAWFGGTHPIALKAIFLAADVGLIALLLRSGVTAWMVLLYVVNPLAIKEIGFSLHPDGIIALWLTLAVLMLHRGRWLRAAFFTAAVVCAKLPLLLLAASLNLRNAAHRKVLLGGALIALAAYLPFLFPDPALPFVGLRAFGDAWRFNALGFHVFEWIAGAGLHAQARAILAFFYGAAVLAVVHQVATHRLSTQTAMVLFLSLVLLTAPTVNPWYWLPVLPLAIVCLHHDRIVLVTPWIGSFVLPLGYVNGAMLADFGLGVSRAEFGVLPAATLVQAVVMTASLSYDLFHVVSGRAYLDRPNALSTLAPT